MDSNQEVSCTSVIVTGNDRLAENPQFCNNCGNGSNGVPKAAAAPLPTVVTKRTNNLKLPLGKADHIITCS